MEKVVSDIGKEGQGLEQKMNEWEQSEMKSCGAENNHTIQRERIRIEREN